MAETGRRLSLEALVLSFLLLRGARGARLGELEALVESAAAAGVLAGPAAGDPKRGLVSYLAYLKRNQVIEVEGDRIYLAEDRVSPPLRRVLLRLGEEVLKPLISSARAPRADGLEAARRLLHRGPGVEERQHLGGTR